MNISFDKVSVHGGHSGTYCGHAQDNLQQVVARYAECGFAWVCLTEHMPPQQDHLRPPEETAQDLSIAHLQSRFADYMDQARQLQQAYAGQLEILVGFETEAYTGYQEEVQQLIDQHQPDMLVGSVHHVRDILFDGSAQHYAQAVDACGGIEALYCEYFDRQLELINHFEPAVIGHFDLIRIYDSDYPARWQVPEIRERCLRNLNRIKELGLILDLNVRAIKKGASEPYLSEPWMRYAIDNQLAMATGDDSHGVADVGTHLEQAVQVLLDRGGHTDWRKPMAGRHLT